MSSYSRTEMEKVERTGSILQQKNVSFPQNLGLCTLKMKRFAEMNKIADDSIHKRGNFIDFIDSRQNKWIFVMFPNPPPPLFWEISPKKTLI